MSNKIIDYDLTIKNFFESVITFLNKRTEKAKDKKEYLEIVKNIEIINKIGQDPKRLSDYGTRIKENLEPDFEGFCKKNAKGIIVDNSVCLAFSQVLHAIDEYYNGNTLFNKEEHLLLAIKKWKYKTSTSLFKDFVFPFRSEKSFASRISLDALKEKQR